MAQEDSIYNDNPMQRFPIGMEPPNYGIVEVQPQEEVEARIDPPNWWVGMAHRRVELMIHDRNIGSYDVAINEYEGVEIVQVSRVENPNYLFVELDIGPGTQAGTLQITLSKDREYKIYNYELLERNRDPQRIQGLDPSDFIYLIMPDRFANGDSGNDSFEDMNQVGTNREKIFFRHGGDLLGVMEHLDYLEDLGVTAIWLNPVLENNQPYDSYHGYAVTDHYKIDKRLGTNAQYQQLVNLAHERGIKIVMDIIHNHMGDQHYLFQDLPSKDFIHQFEEYTRSNFRIPSLLDPYAAESDVRQFNDGWFDNHMPDLNQQNPHVAIFLIQNNIWWLEFSGQDSYRVDTYPYPDQRFMTYWVERILKEYPHLGMFGETWVQGPAIQAWFTKGHRLNEDAPLLDLPGVTDFQMHYAMLEAVTQPQSWENGISRVYLTLAQDYLYENPYQNVIFLDNHDLSRFFAIVEKDMNRFKSGITLLFTLRGIPMLYYGTEILLSGSGGMFGEGGRQDFLGGWEEDEVNKFKAEGRTEEEQEAFEYVRALANYRKNTPALQTGKMTQYVPENGIYVFFRYDTEKTVMVVTNTNDEAVRVSTERYAEMLQGYSQARNVVSGEQVKNLSEIELTEHSAVVLELE